MRVWVANRQRRRRVSTDGLVTFVKRLCRSVPAADADEVSVALVSDRAMRELNRRWRGVDATTDVLSFPSGTGTETDAVRSLGDIVISIERASEQARAAGHSLARELRVLLVHGYLHLLGYDHEVDDGKMMRLQRRLLRNLAGRRGSGATS